MKKPTNTQFEVCQLNKQVFAWASPKLDLSCWTQLINTSKRPQQPLHLGCPCPKSLVPGLGTAGAPCLFELRLKSGICRIACNVWQMSGQGQANHALAKPSCPVAMQKAKKG